MRKIEFKELKIKDTYDEEKFYQFYLENLQEKIANKKEFKEPVKQYEIFYLNILGGKILLLDKDYIMKEDTTNQELYYDYYSAYKIYNYLLDIYDGIEDEKNEVNELYKEERLKIDNEIEKIKKEDNELYKKAVEDYNIMKNSQLYKEYIKIIEENKELKEQNEELNEKINNITKNNMGFIQKILNKFRNRKLLKDGENKW